MPGWRPSPHPSITFGVDKWPDPEFAIWFTHGVKPYKYFCSTKKCAFKCQRPSVLKKHEETCTNEPIVRAKFKIYG